MKKSILLTALLSFSLFITACGGGENSGEATEEKGELDVYTHNDSEEMQDLVDGLEEETGIKLNVLRTSSGEGWCRMQYETYDFGYDMLWSMLQSIALKAEKEDILEPYESEEGEDVPDEFKDEDGKWYGWSYWFNLLGINEDILEEKGLDKPESWDDLLDPQYEGEIVLPDPGTRSEERRGGK